MQLRLKKRRKKKKKRACDILSEVWRKQIQTLAVIALFFYYFLYGEK